MCVCLCQLLHGACKQKQGGRHHKEWNHQPRWASCFWNTRRRVHDFTCLPCSLGVSVSGMLYSYTMLWTPHTHTHHTHKHTHTNTHTHTHTHTHTTHKQWHVIRYTRIRCYGNHTHIHTTHTNTHTHTHTHTHHTQTVACYTHIRCYGNLFLETLYILFLLHWKNVSQLSKAVPCLNSHA